MQNAGYSLILCLKQRIRLFCLMVWRFYSALSALACKTTTYTAATQR